MRRVGIIIAGIVGIVVIAVLVFAATFNVNKYRGTIQSQLQKHLGRSVTLGDMHLRVFPPKFRVQDLAIADDTNFSADTPFIKRSEEHTSELQSRRDLVCRLLL